MTGLRTALIVDDDDAMREMVASLLSEEGFRTVDVDNAEKALELLRERDVDVVLSDIQMPGLSGIEMLGELRQIRASTPVVLMTAFGSIDSAIDAMRAGAFDYIRKPFRRDEVLVVLERALAQRELEDENRRLRRAVDETGSFGQLIGTSPAMRDIYALIRKIANNRSSVLITGDSGTGKELVARTIHFSGNRSEKAFIPINCTALPEGLLESELFGHVRGAFTGANASKRGLFEEAAGGTLFLDEIGDMGLALQSKLLRALQDGEIRPVGGNRSIKVDVRIIAATNQDLEKGMEEGGFRRDLFYRLNVIPICIPPLRERPEDIPALVTAFLKKHSPDRARTVSAAAMRQLNSCPWEGNARELENVIERVLALSDGAEIALEDLPRIQEESPSQAATAGDLVGLAERRQLSLRELESLYIDRVLEQTRGNKVQAAKILGINRRTLYRRGQKQSCAESFGDEATGS